MERDDFTCVSCNDTESTLNVHHCYYESGLEPWDYSETSLVTLCEACHEDQRGRGESENMLLRVLAEYGFLSEHLERLAEFAKSSNGWDKEHWLYTHFN